MVITERYCVAKETTQENASSAPYCAKRFVCSMFPRLKQLYQNWYNTVTDLVQLCHTTASMWLFMCIEDDRVELREFACSPEGLVQSYTAQRPATYDNSLEELWRKDRHFWDF